MKKILLGMILICFFCTNAFSQVDRISGQQAVYAGEKHLYSIWFKTALTADTKFTVTTGEFGYFSSPGDTLKTFNVEKGKMYHEFWVTWGNTATNNAKITAYKNGDSPTSAKTYSIKILEKPTSPNPGIREKDIFGYDIVYCGDEITYEGAYLGWCDGPSKYVVSWKYDNEIFEGIKISSTGCRTNALIKLKVREINNESVETNIETNVKSYWDGKLVEEYTARKKVTIKYKPTFGLTTGNNIICSNETVSYNITGIKPFMTNYNIIWEAEGSITLVSGQGTPNATFKAMENGNGKIKATIKYDDKTYTLENSNLWVGPPATPTQINGIAAGGYYNPYTTYIFNVLPVNGAEEYVWKAVGATLSTNIKPYLNVNLTTDKYASFSLQVSTKNKCGTSLPFGINGYKKPDTGGGGGNTGPPTIDPPGGGGNPIPVNVPMLETKNIRIYYFTTGSLVHQEKNAINFNIQNTNLKAGIYIIETTDKDGNKTTEKVYKKD